MNRLINIILMQEAVRTWDGRDVTELMSRYGLLKRLGK